MRSATAIMINPHSIIYGVRASHSASHGVHRVLTAYVDVQQHMRVREFEKQRGIERGKDLKGGAFVNSPQQEFDPYMT